MPLKICSNPEGYEESYLPRDPDYYLWSTVCGLYFHQSIIRFDTQRHTYVPRSLRRCLGLYCGKYTLG